MPTPPHPHIEPSALAVQPLARAETIPSAWYTEPAFHPFEQEALFARSWQLVGHEARLREPGSVLAATVAGNPIVVVRGQDDELRAFYNVCRHRGGPLATEPCGQSRHGVLRCQYHGWTYRLDGTLRGVPRFNLTELFDKRDLGLVPVRLARWQGLLFAALDGEPPPLETLLDGIAARIAPLRLDRLHFYRRDSYAVACNWKVYVDNYLEGYHVPLVHPELTKRLDFPSYATETAAWHSLQHSGLGATGEGLYADPSERAYYYFVFPNMMLNILPGRLQSNLVEPVAHDRCLVHFDYFYADLQSDSIAEDIAFSDAVQREDVDICEHVQRGLASRAYDQGRFSVEMEQGVYHFQCLLKASYQQALATLPTAAAPATSP